MAEWGRPPARGAVSETRPDHTGTRGSNPTPKSRRRGKPLREKATAEKPADRPRTRHPRWTTPSPVRPRDPTRGCSDSSAHPRHEDSAPQTTRGRTDTGSHHENPGGNSGSSLARGRGEPAQ